MYYYSNKQLFIDNGYLPIPIVPYQKFPAIKNWTAEDYAPPPGYGRSGIGILCGRGDYPICGIDCDIKSPEVAERLTAYILKTCGETVYRIGQAPKIMIVYRAERAGIRKTSSKHYDIGHVEFWG